MIDSLSLPTLGYETESMDAGQTSLNARDWSAVELEAAVASYMGMLKCELEGIPYEKTGYNRALREGQLPLRSKGSVEKRMQNISAVMQELRLPFIRGYVPIGNVGSNVKVVLKAAIEKYSVNMPFAATFDLNVLEDRVTVMLQQPLIDAPIGNTNPRQSIATVGSYERSPAIKAWVLKHAGPYCEGCHAVAPFEVAPGRPYLEVHHVIPLANGGPDTVENAVALCPNCHRRCHYSFARDEFIRDLYLKILRLMPRPVDIDDLNDFI